MKQCVFCDGEIAADAPPEHVIPQWMQRLRPKHARFASPRAVVIKGEPPTPLPELHDSASKVPTIVTNEVCGDCNGRWMSDLETRASPMLRPMITGEPRRLSVEEQAFIATWAVKTDMAWQTAPTSVRATPLTDYRWLRERKMPPPHTRVRLGCYVGAALPFTDHNLAHLGELTANGVDLEGDPEGHWTTLRIGQVVFEILGSRDGRLPSIHRPSLSGTVLIDIWPSVEDRFWPPPVALDDRSMLALMGITPEQLPFDFD